VSARVPVGKGAMALGLIFLIPFILLGLGMKPAYVVAGAIFTLFLSLLIVNFQAGFLALIFTRSSIDYLKNFTGSDVNLAAAISLVLIVLGVFYVLCRKVNVLQFEESAAFLIFITICGVSLLYSPNLTESLSDWLRLVSIFAVYVLARVIFDTRKKIQTLFIVILLSALIPICLAYYQLLTGQGGVLDSGENRIVGTFLHPNAFASYLLILIIFCTAQILEKSRYLSKPLLAALTLSALVIFVFTFSRGAWIVFVAAMLMMGVLRHRMILKIFPLGLVAVVFLVPSIRHRIGNIFDPGYTRGRSGWDWRVDTWREISTMVEQKPFLGHGLSSVESVYGILTHNDYLRLTAEVGFLGLFAYLFLSWTLLSRTWIDYQSVRSRVAKSFQIGLLVMIASFMIRQFADNTLRNTVMMIYFWIFVAISRNIARFEVDSSKEERPA